MEQNLIGYQVGDYVCISVLGEGSFGKVYKAVSVHDSERIVALKFMSKTVIEK